MADVYRFRQRKKATFRSPFANHLTFSQLFGDTGSYTHFSIQPRRKTKRRERHYEVWFHSGDGQVGLNLSYIKNVFPTTEQEARDYVKVFARGHGLYLTELVREKPKRWPRASRDDAELLKQGIVKEEWLTSDVPTLWARAIAP